MILSAWCSWVQVICFKCDCYYALLPNLSHLVVGMWLCSVHRTGTVEVCSDILNKYVTKFRPSKSHEFLMWKMYLYWQGQCLMRQIVDRMYPRSYDKGSPWWPDWVQWLLLDIKSNYGLSDWIQSLPLNVSSDTWPYDTFSLIEVLFFLNDKGNQLADNIFY